MNAPRLRSLISYLVLKRGENLPRPQVAFLFWPDSTEKQALANLRRLLHELRRALPEFDRYLEVNAKTIEWREDAAVSLDVERFCGSIREACETWDTKSRQAARGSYETAVEVYRGALLPENYEEWAVELREELSEDYAEALRRLVAIYEEEGRYEQAIRFGKALKRHDSVCETTYVTLIRLYRKNGDRASAMQVFRECEDILDRELGVKPSGETRLELAEGRRERRFASGERTPRTDIREPEIPLCGRGRQWRELREEWERTRSGSARMVVLVGEAGIGKSRLAEELYCQAQKDGCAASRTRCYGAEGRLAYAPVCDWMRSSELRSALSKLGSVWQAEVARLLPEMKVEGAGSPERNPQVEKQRRHALFEALSHVVQRVAGPVLLLLDDLQWADQETLEWLRFLLRFAPESPVLIVGTVREEEVGNGSALLRFLQDLGRNEQLRKVHVGALSVGETSLLASYLRGEELKQWEVERLHASTGGNPLFVVETLRAGLHFRDDDSLDSLEGVDDSARLPPKVHAVLDLRLGQLSASALEALRVAAVFGRAFTSEMLSAVGEYGDEVLVDLLDVLWEKRMIRELEPGLYDFSHDKLRELTYEQMGVPRRRLLHRKSAQVLEAFFEGNLDRVRAQLASHYEESGEVTRAIEAYRKAAFSAKEINATREAIRLFSKALDLLSRKSEDRDALDFALELNTNLGTCHVSEFGYQSDGVRGIYERSRSLCIKLGKPTTPPVLRGLALHCLTHGQLRKTLLLGDELGVHFEESGDSVLYVESEYVLGVGCFWLGRLTESAQHLENSLERYDVGKRHVHISLYSQDPLTVCLCRLAWCRLFQGYVDQALKLLGRSIEAAEESNHPHTEGYALYFGAQICFDAGDLEAAGSYLERFDRLVSKQQILFWEMRCEMLQAYFSFSYDGKTSALDRFREQLEYCLKREHLIGLSSFLGLYVESLRKQDRQAEGIEALARYRERLRQSEEAFCESELLRQEGELHVDSGETELGVGLLKQAYHLAERQGSLLLELKAANRLAEFAMSEGRTGAAICRLRAVCDRFEESFEHAEYRRARDILQRAASR